MKLNFSHHKPIVPGKNDLKDNFRKWMFWDVNMDKLSISHDKFFIVDRVLSGSMENPIYLERLERIFSKQEIIKAAKSSNSIRGNEAIRFIAKRYGISPNSFKQYIPNL